MSQGSASVSHRLAGRVSWPELAQAPAQLNLIAVCLRFADEIQGCAGRWKQKETKRDDVPKSAQQTAMMRCQICNFIIMPTGRRTPAAFCSERPDAGDLPSL